MICFVDCDFYCKLTCRMIVYFPGDDDRHLIQRAARERAAIVARYDLVSKIVFSAK